MANTNTANQNQMDARSMRISREEEISAVINAKYSIDQQIAILRQRDTKPEEYEAFYNFAEQVKSTVKASRAAETASAGGGGE